MKKKGFTLIELLAVIVILAIVSLIAVPMIMQVIEKVNIKAAESSANSYKESITQLIAENEIKGINQLKPNNTYYVTRGTTIDGQYYEAINDVVKLKGYKPTGYDDYIKFGKNYEIEEAILTINGYAIKIEENNIATIEKGQIIELEYITVNETETMERGSSYTIETIFEPINTSDQRIKYTTSDKNIVTVDENGLVKAVNNGEAIVTVTPSSNKKLKKEIKITVISPSEVTGIKLNKESTIIGLGKSEDLIATLEPSDATSSALTWESNNVAVTVTDSGKITGVSLGSATVTATTQSGLKANIEVTVEYEVKVNDTKHYTTNNNLVINDVNITDETNISCNNGSIPKYENNTLTISNITSSVECVINDSLKTTIDNIDSSLNNILMINDESLNNQDLIINENDNIVIDINGKTIISTFNEDKPSILNNGNLTIKDSLNIGILKTNYRLIKSYGNLNIESGNYKRENVDSVDGGVIHIVDGEAILKNSNFQADITWAIFTYTESEEVEYNPVIKIDNCNISTSNGVAINNYISNGKIYLYNSNIIEGNTGIENNGEQIEIINVDFNNIKTGIINKNGIININNSTITASNYAMRNYLGEINITSGIYKSNSNVIYNESSGSVNISDEDGKVHLYGNSSLGVIYNASRNNTNDESIVTIRGHRASKTTNNGIVYDDLACTADPSTMDSGICIYGEHAGITNGFGTNNIDGVTIISRYIGLYQIRKGNSYIKNSYIKNYGDTCDINDIAFCVAVRNHYSDSYLEIVDSDIINEHGIALSLVANNDTTVTNSNIKSATSNAILMQAGSNLLFNSGVVSTDASVPVFGLNTTGTVTIKDGVFNTINETNIISTSKGILNIEGGKYTSNYNTVGLFGDGNIYISGGEFITTTDLNYRSTIENSGQGNIYINGGTYKAPNGGSAFKFQGKEGNGNIYLCNANISGIYDAFNLDGISGTLYYSNNIKFTDGTNIPKVNNLAKVSANYAGTCKIS